MSRTEPTSTDHHERLWPGALGWAFVVGFAVVVAISLVPVRPVVGVVAGGAALVVAVVAAVWSSPRVRVQDGELQAGRAHIPVRHLGEPEALDRAGVRAAMGPGSDARTYACLRAWISGAVLVPVVDPEDPTPAWLVSSRHPERLASAVRSAQAENDQAAHSEQIG